MKHTFSSAFAFKRTRLVTRLSLHAAISRNVSGTWRATFADARYVDAFPISYAAIICHAVSGISDKSSTWICNEINDKIRETYKSVNA